MKGFSGKMLVADLRTGDLCEEPLNAEVALQYLGGGGYAARYLYDLVDRNTDPLGPQNPLLFMTGPLAGTRAPSASRWVVCARSPLTGIWGETNCGGSFGAEVKLAGFDGILVKGASERPVYLYVRDDVQELRDASDLWGLGIYETHRRLKKDPLTMVACIGPAGEKMVKYASIGSEERAAGRTGMGAVMGSKKLKAISVRGKKKEVELANAEEFNVLAQELHTELREVFTNEMFRDIGTSGAVDLYNYRGELPVKYWTKGEFQGASEISGSAMKETILVRNRHCFACPIGCGRVVRVTGKYATPGEVEGPEYETVAGFGSLLLNDNLEAIARMNYLCNDWGVDTISSSVVLALLCHLYEKGKITAKDVDGVSPVWGDVDAFITLLEKIAFREGVGSALAEGAVHVGRVFKADPEEVATVDGLEVTFHDLRSCYGMALAYAASPRGPDHNALDMYQTCLGQPFPELDIQSPDFFDDGMDMVQACVRLQDYRAFYSAVVMCVFANPSPPAVGRLLTLATGWEIGLPEIKRIGERVLNMKRLFDVKMGLTAEWDRLPRIVTDPLSEGGACGKSPDWRKMVDLFYTVRGWDPVTGAPKREKREELGLPLV